MSLNAWQQTIVDAVGNVVSAAAIEVKLVSTGAFAAIFSDVEGTVPLANPFAADVDGFARFYAATGLYRIRAYNDDSERLWENFQLGLSAVDREVLTDYADAGDAAVTVAAAAAATAALASGLAAAATVAANATAAVNTRVTDSRAYRGVHLTPSALGHRVGRVAYRRSHSGRAELVSSLQSYYPAAAFDPINFPGVTRYYVDQTSGSDAAAGTSWATALKRISAALAKSDVDVVLIRGGQTYALDTTAAQGIGEYTGTRDIVLVAIGPRARVTSAREVTWTAHATEANVYQSSSTGGGIATVVDTRTTDANGDFLKLTNVASIALVGTTPGSWFYASSVCYVRLGDSAVPAHPAVLALRDALNRVSADGIKWYMKNIHFIGGSAGAFSARDATSATVVIAEDCWFTHNYVADGYQIKDIGLSIAIRCRASANANDGFNYHELNSLSPHFIEIDCVGMGNLANGTGNGSTCHESVVGIRLNCDYARNAGPGVADINLTKTFNAGCTSIDNTGHANCSGFLVTDTGEMWIDGCTVTGNQGHGAAASETATMHWRELYSSEGDAPVNVGGTATINQSGF